MERVRRLLAHAFGSGLEIERNAQREAALKLDRALRDALGEAPR